MDTLLRLRANASGGRAQLLGLGVAGAMTLAGCAAPAPAPPQAPVHAAMSERDTALADQTVQRGLETSGSGVATAWRNELSGASGTVTPLRTYRSRSGRFCREYEEVVVIDARVQRYLDTACRDDGGQWRLVPAADE